MQAIDRNAAAIGIPLRVLMESSGHAIAREILEIVSPGATINLVCGTGNNGGDAFVAARFLEAYSVSITLIGHPSDIRTDIARKNWELLETAGYDRQIVTDGQDCSLPSCDVIVDAVCGTGIRGALRDPAASVAREINAADATVVSVDVPSGLDADTGEMPGVVVEADRVVTFHDTKPGLESLDIPVTVADIGIPAVAERIVGPGDIAEFTRADDAHKGQAGRILVIGGGPYTGAPALSGLAALRTGADLVEIATPTPVAATVQSYAPDLLVTPLPGERVGNGHASILETRASEADCLVVGPGIGAAAETQDVLREFFTSYTGRAIVDAEALDTVLDLETDASLICTPHRGEFSRLGEPLPDDPADRFATVTRVAEMIEQTIVLKGPEDLISDGRVGRINRTGNPGMTVGGTGDVLAGVLGALYAEPTVGSLAAGCMGTYLTGAAGDSAYTDRGYGLIASDVLEALPHVIRGISHDG